MEVGINGGRPYNADMRFNFKAEDKERRTEPVVEGNADQPEPVRDEWDSRGSEKDLSPSDNMKPVEGDKALEPYVGMEFGSEDDARRFYNDYAKRSGFVVRVLQRRPPDVEGETLARRLGCNKQGFSSSTKVKPAAREGCRASILFKLRKSGKWVVTSFAKDHNHPLAVSGNENFDLHDKDQKIQGLAHELHRQEEQFAAYRETLVNLLANVEKEAGCFNSNVLAVVENVRKAESEALSEALALTVV